MPLVTSSAPASTTLGLQWLRFSLAGLAGVMDEVLSNTNADDMPLLPSDEIRLTHVLIDETTQQEAMQTVKKKRDQRLVHDFRSFKSSYKSPMVEEVLLQSEKLKWPNNAIEVQLVFLYSLPQVSHSNRESPWTVPFNHKILITSTLRYK